MNIVYEKKKSILFLTPLFIQGQCFDDPVELVKALLLITVHIAPSIHKDGLP